MLSSSGEVLIAAEGDWYGVCRLPKLLQRAGLKPTLLVLPRSLARRTRYAHCLPLEGAYSVGQVVQELRRHLAQNPGKYQMIIPGDDMIVRALATEPDKEWLRPWFPVEPSEEKLNLIQSKAALLAACTEAGLPTPRAAVCTDMTEAVAAAREIGYPVFLKGEESSGGRGVGRAENEAELLHLAAILPPQYFRNFSVQKAIDGQLGSGAVFAWRGEAVQWSSHYRSVTWPAPYGPSSQIEFMRHPDIELIARGLARITGFHGFFGVDWIHSKTSGRCEIIEMNPRPTPQLNVSRRGGADFAEGLRHVLAGGPKPTPLSAQAPHGVHPLFPEDLYRCHADRDYRGLGQWLWKIVRGRADIPWDDRSLAIGMLKKFGRHYRAAQRETSGNS